MFVVLHASLLIETIRIVAAEQQVAGIHHVLSRHAHN
jgi:hypothetical protein